MLQFFATQDLVTDPAVVAKLSSKPGSYRATNEVIGRTEL